MNAPPPTYLVLDIETVPDGELFDPPQSEPGMERPFPPLYACQPIALGMMWLDEGLTCKRLGIIGEGKDEPGMLADFAAFMSDTAARLVTWNGRTFDLPVLTLRALRHGVSFPWYFQERPNYRDRYSDEGHLDLGDFLANRGAARMISLDGAARLMGLPGKGAIDGSQVEALYRSGQIQAVRDYCLSDVVQTGFLLLRCQLLAGKIDRAGYRRAAEALLAAVAADGRVEQMVRGVDRARLLLAAAAAASGG
jgi:predicted PolB exonuclease-like 3'-5' exonuclease